MQARTAVGRTDSMLRNAMSSAFLLMGMSKISWGSLAQGRPICGP